MSIVTELKELIVKRGGETDGIVTISQAVKVLTDLESASETEPASGLTEPEPVSGLTEPEPPGDSEQPVG